MVVGVILFYEGTGFEDEVFGEMSKNFHRGEKYLN